MPIYLPTLYSNYEHNAKKINNNEAPREQRSSKVIISSNREHIRSTLLQVSRGILHTKYQADLDAHSGRIT